MLVDLPPDELLARLREGKVFRLAARRGNGRACYNLGLYYDTGRVGKASARKAFTSYLRAADLGDVEAARLVGYQLHSGLGVRRNDGEAVSWHRKAARGGDAYAMHNLAQCYLEGEGVAKSASQARRWFEKAASRGLTKSKSALKKLS